MRKRCEFTLDTIEKLYETEHKYILSRFVRFTANKRDFNPNIQNPNSKAHEKSLVVRTSRNGVDMEFELKKKLADCFSIKVHSN